MSAPLRDESQLTADRIHLLHAKHPGWYAFAKAISEPAICAFYLSVGKAFDGVKFARETVDAAIDEQIGRAALRSEPTGDQSK